MFNIMTKIMPKPKAQKKVVATFIKGGTPTKSYSAVAASKGKDIGKPGKNFSKIAASAGKEYGSTAAGKKVAGAILAKLRRK